MKKLVLGLVAASIAATPAMAAAPQQYRGYDAPRHQTAYRDDQRGYGYQNGDRYQHRNWQRGQRFDSRYARNYRQIDYRQYRGLRAPPRGFRYVQSGNDAVLVAITSGIIAAVFGNMIR